MADSRGTSAGYDPTLASYRSNRVRDTYANGGFGQTDYGDTFGGAGGNQINAPASPGGGTKGYGGIRAVKDAPKGVF